MRLSTLAKDRVGSAKRYLALRSRVRRIIARLSPAKQPIDISTTLAKPWNPAVRAADEVRGEILGILAKSEPGAAFCCAINGIDMVAPRDVLNLYPHCLHPAESQRLTYYVETNQSNWLCSKLRRGDTAFDVGASVGLLSVAMARTVGDAGRIYSFEPSRGTFRVLQRMIRLNDLANHLHPVPAAIAAARGEVEFIEYLSNNELSWAPDASTIASGVTPGMRHVRYHVDVSTIDLFSAASKAVPRAIKIDIEGFEIDALQGAVATIEQCRPFLCIDIHTDPRTHESSRSDVESFLARLGYQCRMEGHALYADHPRHGNQR